jgi:eukaryotic-like serine/threonine-protein kinase
MDRADHASAPSTAKARHWAERWARLEPHIDLLLTLPPDARLRWLDQHAIDNAEGAAHLRALLAARDEASNASFLQGSAAPAWAAPMLQRGEAIGAYTLVEPIGEGGMGIVWRARRSDGRFEGEAAIKLLHRGRFDQAAQMRFRREGAILAGLRHPGIAQLFDAGLTDAGQPYLVLEFVDGEAIDRWCARTRLPLRERLQLFLQVLDAVAEAHAQLVIHRDLKPSNILVTHAGRVKLLDFGIARLLHEDEGAALTRDGALALTPAYAAPEQFNGGALSLSTDVYALGVVLYELLTGTHPSGLDASAPAIAFMRSAAEGNVPRASERARQRQLRGDLDNILARATAPDAARRYRTVPEFADDVRRHLNHEPVAAHEAGWSYRAAKFVRRHALATGLSMVSVVALASGISATAWQAQRAQAERDRAERMLARSDAANNFVSVLLTQVGRADHPMTFNEIIETGERLASLQSGGNAANRAVVLLELASFYQTVGSSDKAKRLAEQAVALGRQDGDASLTATAQCLLGTAVTSLGDGPRGEALIADAVRLAADDPDALVMCWQQRGFIAKDRGDAAGLLESAQRAGEALGHMRHASPLTRAIVHDSFAEAYRLLGRYGDAESRYAQAIETLRAAGALDSIEGSTIYNNWGIAAGECGQFKQALERYQRAMRIQTEIMGTDSTPPFSLINAARLLIELDRLDEAWALAEQASQRAASSGGRQYHFYAEIAKSNVRRRQGRFVDAGAHLEAARGQLDALQPAPPRLRQRLQFGLAQLDRDQSRPEAALQRLDALRDELRPTPSAPHKPSPVEQAVLKERADTLAALGRTAAALADARTAVGLARALQRDAPASATTGSALLTLARLQWASGEHAAAEASAREAVRQLDEAAGAQHPDARAARALAAL